MATVICGGGIMGCATAYFLAKKNMKCIIIEAVGIAHAASGKAGGFLARDWSDNSALAPLVHRSFDLHMKLAEEFKDCDYRRVVTVGIDVTEGRTVKKELDSLPDWVQPDHVTSCHVMGDTTTTAQVTPYKLCQRLLSLAQQLSGAECVIGTVQDLVISDGKVTAVIVDGKEIPATSVVVTMGPWSGKLEELLRNKAGLKVKVPVNGQRAHSIVIDAASHSENIGAQAVFLQYSGNKCTGDPEIYPRPDGSVYMCGMSDSCPLPDNPMGTSYSQEACGHLRHMLNNVVPSVAEVKEYTEQACYLPCSSDGLPLIGQVTSVQGLYIATGHSCWGILCGPATGEAVAELIVDGCTQHVDIAAYNPGRFSKH